MLLEPPLRRGGIETVAGERRDGGMPVAPKRRELRIVQDGIGQKDLTRFEPRDLRRKTRSVRFLTENRPVEMSTAARP